MCVETSSHVPVEYTCLHPDNPSAHMSRHTVLLLNFRTAADPCVRAWLACVAGGACMQRMRAGLRGCGVRGALSVASGPSSIATQAVTFLSLVASSCALLQQHSCTHACTHSCTHTSTHSCMHARTHARNARNACNARTHVHTHARTSGLDSSQARTSSPRQLCSLPSDGVMSRISPVPPSKE